MMLMIICVDLTGMTYNPDGQTTQSIGSKSTYCNSRKCDGAPQQLHMLGVVYKILDEASCQVGRQTL